MGEVIKIEFGGIRNPEGPNFLKKLRAAARRDVAEKKGGIELLNPGDLSRGLKANIINGLAVRGLTSPKFALCGIRAADIVFRGVFSPPDNWRAFDHLQNADDQHPENLKKGGELCFMVCAFFSQGGKYRLVDIDYYEKMGAEFYYRLHGITNVEVDLTMGSNFPLMAEIAGESLKKI